jgi:hypothetical protein
MISISDSQPAIHRAAIDLDGVLLIDADGGQGESRVGRYRRPRPALQRANLRMQRCVPHAGEGFVPKV